MSGLIVKHPNDPDHDEHKIAGALILREDETIISFISIMIDDDWADEEHKMGDLIRATDLKATPIKRVRFMDGVGLDWVDGRAGHEEHTRVRHQEMLALGETDPESTNEDGSPSRLFKAQLNQHHAKASKEKQGKELLPGRQISHQDTIRSTKTPKY